MPSIRMSAERQQLHQLVRHLWIVNKSKFPRLEIEIRKLLQRNSITKVIEVASDERDGMKPDSLNGS